MLIDCPQLKEPAVPHRHDHPAPRRVDGAKELANAGGAVIAFRGATVGVDRWQRLTRQANDAFAASQHDSAAGLYGEALAEAEALLRHAGAGRGPSRAAAIFVISHHNLAELALARGRRNQATHHYREAFDGLLAIAGSPSAPNALRQACATQLQPAIIALATHLQFCGCPASEIAGHIARARDVVLRPRGAEC